MKWPNNEILKSHRAILGKTGSGKTVTEKVSVEYLLKEKERVVIFDPTGVWWGMRLKADGKAPAFNIPLFGGKRGDVALNPASGRQLAEIIATTDMSCILDTSSMRSLKSNRSSSRNSLKRFIA